MKTYFTIGQASQFLNITVETIRYYEKEGIIPPFERGSNGYRKISMTHLLYLKGVTQLRQAGFSLQDIQEMHQDQMTSDQSYDFINQGLDHITEQIFVLEKVKSALESNLESLRTFYELKEKGLHVLQLEQVLPTTPVSNLPVKDLLSDEDLIIALTESKTVSRHYLMKAFIYKEEVEIEKHIKEMYDYCYRNALTATHAIYLNILSGPSYYVGDAMAAILYLNLEDPS